MNYQYQMPFGMQNPNNFMPMSNMQYSIEDRINLLEQKVQNLENKINNLQNKNIPTNTNDAFFQYKTSMHMM